MDLSEVFYRIKLTRTFHLQAFFVIAIAVEMILPQVFDLSFRLKEVRHVAGRLSGYKVAENSVIQCLSLVGRLYFKSALS